MRLDKKSNFLGKVSGTRVNERTLYKLTFIASTSKDWRSMWMRPKWLFSVLNKRGAIIHIQFIPSSKGAQKGLAWTEVVSYDKSLAEIIGPTFDSEFRSESTLVACSVPPIKNPADFPEHYFGLIQKKSVVPPLVKPPVLEVVEDDISQFDGRLKSRDSESEVLRLKKGEKLKNKSSKKSKVDLRRRVFGSTATLVSEAKAWRSNYVTCIRCGEKLKSETLLKHKEIVHGEKVNPLSPAKSRRSRSWVSIVQGGLPGLGRRR